MTEDRQYAVEASEMLQEESPVVFTYNTSPSCIIIDIDGIEIGCFDFQLILQLSAFQYYVECGTYQGYRARVNNTDGNIASPTGTE